MSIIQTIHQLEQTVSAAFKDGFAAAGHNITPCQFVVLRAIQEHDGASQTQIVSIIASCVPRGQSGVLVDVLGALTPDEVAEAA